MGLPEDCRLTFTISDEAWYYTDLTGRGPEIYVHASAAGGGVAWEFSIHQVSTIGVRADIFDETWPAFVQVPELFAALAKMGGAATLHQVRTALLDLGAEDITRRDRPADMDFRSPEQTIAAWAEDRTPETARAAAHALLASAKADV